MYVRGRLQGRISKKPRRLRPSIAGALGIAHHLSLSSLQAQRRSHAARTADDQPSRICRAERDGIDRLDFAARRSPAPRAGQERARSPARRSGSWWTSRQVPPPPASSSSSPVRAHACWCASQALTVRRGRRFCITYRERKTGPRGSATAGPVPAAAATKQASSSRPESQRARS